MKIYLSHSGNYDYGAELYAPLKSSEIAREHQIFFPHDKENIDTKTKEVIRQSDLVVAEVSYPSTGQGIELGWAESADVPILCMHKTGAKPSNSLRFIAKDFIEYADQADMLQKVQNWLAK